MSRINHCRTGGDASRIDRGKNRCRIWIGVVWWPRSMPWRCRWWPSWCGGECGAVATMAHGRGRGRSGAELCGRGGDIGGGGAGNLRSAGDVRRQKKEFFLKKIDRKRSWEGFHSSVCDSFFLFLMWDGFFFPETGSSHWLDYVATGYTTSVRVQML